MKILFILFLSLSFFLSIKGQQRFSDEVLNNSRKYGTSVEQSFDIEETDIFEKDTSQNKVFLTNGLRSSKYKKPESWTSISQDLEVKAISIVFSKYPIRRNGYSMNHKLLFNRLKNLFLIDSYLNDTNIQWKIILQTHCINDEQVDSLFHGVVIEYEKDKEETLENINSVVNIVITPTNTVLGLTDSITSFMNLPDSILLDLEGRNEKERTEILIDYFQDIGFDTTSLDPSKQYSKKKIKLIKKFIKIFGRSGDDVVGTVFDRNPQWKNILIIADWTGSMYQYGAQALLWHSLNYKQSGIKNFTLFNDGDLKSSKQKAIGETGGIYYGKADNIENLIKLYQLVMLNGNGGDGPENDLEAVIKGIEKYPDHNEVILIADNQSCVRDMELLQYIEEPIRVIICGYNNKSSINPQYIKIAEQTGGSLHTIELDIENIKSKLNKKGKISSIMEYDLIIGDDYCYNKKSIYSESYYESKIYYDIDSAKKIKKQILNLDLSSQSLNHTPYHLKRFKQLKTLNLSDNNIKKISHSIYSTYHIQTLDLSQNNIEEIPEKIYKIYGLRNLDLSNNNISIINELPSNSLHLLIHLDLSNNELSHFYKGRSLINLKYLYLDNNNLTEFPSSVTRLRKLKELSLSGNNISTIPKRIGYLKKLEILDLSYNNLSELPSRIYRLRKLKKLIITGNDFTDDDIAKLQQKLPNTIIEYQ